MHWEIFDLLQDPEIKRCLTAIVGQFPEKMAPYVGHLLKHFLSMMQH